MAFLTISFGPLAEASLPSAGDYEFLHLPSRRVYTHDDGWSYALDGEWYSERIELSAISEADVIFRDQKSPEDVAFREPGSKRVSIGRCRGKFGHFLWVYPENPSKFSAQMPEGKDNFLTDDPRWEALYPLHAEYLDSNWNSYEVSYHFVSEPNLVLSTKRGEPDYQLIDVNTLKQAPSEETQRMNFMKALGLEGWMQELIRGRRIQKENPLEQMILKLYLSSLNQSSDTPEVIERAHGFQRAMNPEEKPNFEEVQIVGSSRKLHLRVLNLDEVFCRGWIGADCSTRTRLLRAYEPAHINLAIQEVAEDGSVRNLGQIELVMGYSRIGERLAFFERIQSPNNIRTKELGAIILGLQKLLSNHGITMVNLGPSYNYPGHPLANVKSLVERVKDASSKYFDHVPVGFFVRDQDQYPNEDKIFANLMAKKIEDLKLPIYRMQPNSLGVEHFSQTVRFVLPETHWVARAPYANVDELLSAIQKLSQKAKSQNSSLDGKYISAKVLERINMAMNFFASARSGASPLLCNRPHLTK
jgi:hypothetical protein